MSRENILFGIIGILLGFIVGFMFASSMSQRMQPASASLSQGLPSDHPPIGGQNAGGGGGGNPEQVRAQVTADLEKARNEPQNFDAQLKAAELFYQIGRYDQAIEFLLKANQLKPTDYKTVVLLGVVNLDAKHYEPAEKWYRAALKMKQDDVMVLAGLAEATLQKKDAKSAEEAIAMLEKVDPSSEDLPRFREMLSGLKSGPP
ncbi:MAG TPA: tetratricopeptide repeat protein [Pyrinomonadaceae bacterium]|nr:tetratricopeptide repeat protein [Pyrinomonadaceae bacterium]